MKDMQKMNMKNGALLGICVGAAALIAAACGTTENNTNPGPTASTTGLVTTTGVVPTGSTTGPAPVGPTGPTGGTTGPAPTSSATGGTGPTGPVAPPPSTCTNVDYEVGNDAFTTANLSGVRSVYGYGDDTTSLCKTAEDPVAPGAVCVEGNALDAGTEFTNWGAGIGLLLAETDEAGVVVAPWDATALGIVGMRFTVAGFEGTRPVRVGITQVNDPAITTPADNYEANGFLWGGSSPDSIANGVINIAFADFTLPSWSATNLERGLGADLPEGGDVLDPAKIHSVQLQVASDPGDDPEKYKFCVSGVEWLDAAGNPVTVTIPEPNDTGGDTSGDTGSGGDTSAPAGSGSGDTSAPASSGEDTSGPATLDFATQIQPIITAKCGSANAGCHMNARPPTLPSFGAGEPDATAAAAMKAAISPGAQPSMPPAGQTALTDDERALLIQWADSK